MMTSAWQRWFLVTVLSVMMGLLTAAAPPRQALLLDVNGAIGPATVEYLRRGIDQARNRAAALVIIRIDTPGGLDSSTRDVVRLILSSTVPVATYVAPSGARAASAGTYILTASHVAAMAPGTNVGAATPIAIGTPSPAGGDPQRNDQEKDQGASEAKALADAAAYLRALAKLRGRNVEWADRAVRSSDSLAAHEAVQQRVIDVVASDVADLLVQADGQKVLIGGSTRLLQTRSLAVIELPPSWRLQLLSAITNPNVALILMMIGIYGLLFEFMSPGAIAPGVIGAISLLTGLYALAILPVSMVGVALIALGVGLMTAEALTPTLGAVGIAGIIAFVLGAILLFPDQAPGFRLDWRVIGSLAAASIAFFLLAIRAAWSARRRPVVSGAEEMIGTRGEVIDWSNGQGHVFAHGERWRATGARPLLRGERVRIASRKGLMIQVEPLEGDNR